MGAERDTQSALGELIGGIFGRSIYPASAYREVAQPGPGATVDICAGCEVDCCSRHRIPLTLSDLYLLHSALHLPLRSIVNLIPYRHGAPNHPVLIGRAPLMLVLRRRGKGCLFLLRVGDQRRCGVHALRPMACRLFPFLPDAAAQHKAPEGMLAQRPPRDCPWRWPRTSSQIEQLFALLADNDKRRGLDREVTKIWNAQLDMARTRDNFFEFVSLEMRRREQGGTGRGPWRTQLW